MAFSEIAQPPVSIANNPGHVRSDGTSYSVVPELFELILITLMMRLQVFAWGP